MNAQTSNADGSEIIQIIFNEFKDKYPITLEILSGIVAGIAIYGDKSLISSFFGNSDIIHLWHYNHYSGVDGFEAVSIYDNNLYRKVEDIIKLNIKTI